MKRHDVWTSARVAPADGLEPLPGELRLFRTGASAFAGSRADSLLRHWGVQHLIVGGMAAHVCVLATAMQAHDLGYNVLLPREASAAFTPEQHAMTMDFIAPHFAQVSPMAGVLAELLERARVVTAARRFLDGLRAGDADALTELLAPDLVVEGHLQGQWCKWDRPTYLQRVQQMGPAVQSADIERLSLVADSAEVDTRVALPGGHMRDRLSWVRAGDRWQLHHKSFQHHPVT